MKYVKKLLSYRSVKVFRNGPSNTEYKAPTNVIKVLAFLFTADKYSSVYNNHNNKIYIENSCWNICWKFPIKCIHWGIYFFTMNSHFEDHASSACMVVPMRLILTFIMFAFLYFIFVLFFCFFRLFDGFFFLLQRGQLTRSAHQIPYKIARISRSVFPIKFFSGIVVLFLVRNILKLFWCCCVSVGSHHNVLMFGTHSFTLTTAPFHF